MERTLMLIAGQGHPDPLVEINLDGPIITVAFLANGEYLVSAVLEGVRVWRVEDGKQMVTMAVDGNVCSLAVSQDGKWIAAGAKTGYIFVWDAKTYENFSFSFSQELGRLENIRGIDFSPVSPRLVSAGSGSETIIWDIPTRERVQILPHGDECMQAARYSPQGDRIATGTGKSVRVWDANNDHLLVSIDAGVIPWYNDGLLWRNDHLFVVSSGKIQQINASTGSKISEWPVPNVDIDSCIALPQYGELIAYSAKHTVTFWDTATHAELSLIQLPQHIRSIALSPDYRFLAIGEPGGKITIKSLPRIPYEVPLSRLYPTFQQPDIMIDDTALDSWKRDQLANTDAFLTAAIAMADRNTSHHALASRALVRARLRRWDAAIADANESIKIQPSAICYIAKSMAHVGNGERSKGYRACDIAFGHSHSNHATFLLLIKAIIVFMAGEHEDAIFRLDDLIDMACDNSIYYVAYMHLLRGKSCVENADYKGAIQSFERARAQMRPHTSRALSVVSLISGWVFHGLDITIRHGFCEALYAARRIKEAGECLLDIVNTIDKDIYTTGRISAWFSDFLQRCLYTPESSDDTSLPPSSPPAALKRVGKIEIFTVPRLTVYWALCDHLEMANRITDAVECFNHMNSNLAKETIMRAEQANWATDFKQRCAQKLVNLGDVAADAHQFDEAITQYSASLSLNPAIPKDVFLKRSKVYMAKGSWEDATEDTNRVIVIDPLSPWGHERKHAALHGAGHYDDAIRTFETMLLKISQSPDPQIRERYHEYLHPERTKAAIRAAIDNAIRESPLVLINTDSGRLLDKSGQASSFESQPVFQELVSSMTTHIAHARIEHEVAEYYRYATFSHKWEDNELLFEKVVRIVVYDLEESLTHDKLQMFCKIVREAGYHWAWSNTCCINKADHFVLQEALVSMFKWYEGSAVTIVLLRGVRSPSKRGDLVGSIWNTRDWTFQEYHASKVVRFYTEDWKPYMNLDIHNHKESSEIILEMEEATGVSARALMALRPGLDDIRQKLHLASTRQTTRVEDAAYSLLGIFTMSLPVVYGEGDKALGRLLAQLLASSGDTSILAWTGRSGSFNSCLPAKITVFTELPTTHIPLGLEGDSITAGSRTSSFNSASIMRLYDRVHELPVPSVSGIRMKLPCLAFKLGPLSTSRNTSGHVFRAQTAVLGTVVIKTEENLSRFGSLYLVHPWIDFLLDRQAVGSAAETMPEENVNVDPLSFPGASGMISAAPQTRAPWLTSLWPPSSVSQTDKQMQAFQLVARLQQPFGALLLAAHPGNVSAYRRVAAESLIIVQVEEITPSLLNKLVDSVRTMDVL
ncbi:hypothetical protein OG21DRAFT_1485613 [Imleria badia]|nr:hypothetical protein OG21DRAFT_1485613 [Imleria badia]